MRDEKQIADLLLILRDTGKSDAERQQALKQLLAGEQELQAYLRSDFKANAVESEAMGAEIDDAYSRLEKQMDPVPAIPAVPGKSVGIVFYRRWISVAAAVLLCLAGSWFLWNSKNKPAELAKVTASSDTNVVKHLFKTVRNENARECHYFHLPDGSAVRLDPHSSVRFLDSFSVHKKEVFMEGNALFSVQKESTRPFSVFVNGIEVVDLGTKFSINTSRSLIKVKLIQGKVLIRSVNPAWNVQNVMLKPGQEFSLDTSTRKYAVQFVTPRNEIMPTGKLSKDLAFANASLQEVFERLTKESGIAIHYNIGDIQEMAFTGTFSAGADTKAIISRICMLNDLTYKVSNNAIYVHK